MVVVADGHYVRPVVVSSLFIYSGEKYSVLVTADQDPSRNNWAASHFVGRKRETRSTMAVLNYAGNDLRAPPPGRHGAQGGAEQVRRRGAPPGPRLARAAELAPTARSSFSSPIADRRPRAVGHQRRVAQVPGDAVPRLDEARAARRVRPAFPGGERTTTGATTSPRRRRAGRWRARRTGCPAGAGVGRGRGAAEHGGAQQPE